jgi:hypothetical protein
MMLTLALANYIFARPTRIHWFVLACCLVAAAYQGIAP